MLIRVPDHFSNNLKYVFKGLPTNPAKVIDRISVKQALFGWFFGFLLFCFGIFEILSLLTSNQLGTKSLLLHEMFAIVVILISLTIIIGTTISYVRYKKIIFDGHSFNITYRPTFGVKHIFSEPLENYSGIRLRVLFTQIGLFNKNRYVIDLFHSDINKIVPLYISTQNRDIRKIWEAYAKMFKLPALSVGDRGLVQRNYEDLNKSIKDLAKEDKLPYIASGKLPAPQGIIINETSTHTNIIPSKINWDFFNRLSLIAISLIMVILISCGVYMTLSRTLLPVSYLCLIIALLGLAVYLITKLFTTYKLRIYSDRIVINEVLFDSSIKTDYILNDKIENVELGYDSTTDCYKLAIVGDDKVINFGGRLYVNDLLWLKDFIIRKLIGN